MSETKYYCTKVYIYGLDREEVEACKADLLDGLENLSDIYCVGDGQTHEYSEANLPDWDVAEFFHMGDDEEDGDEA